MATWFQGRLQNGCVFQKRRQKNIRVTEDTDDDNFEVMTTVNVVLSNRSAKI